MKKALVVVDFQNDFVSGSLGFEKAESIRTPIVEKIKNARENGVDIIFTMDAHGSDYLETSEGKALPIKHCIKGTWGWELDSSILPYKNFGIVVEKPSFGSLMLGDLLKNENYDEIEFCGLVTSICVLSNAILAKTILPNAKIVVDSKATEDATNKESALACLRAVQVEVI